MKILWLDDKAGKDVSLQRFIKEWRLEKEDVLAATDIETALQLLRAQQSEIRIAIVDLLWPGQVEKITEPPLGLEFIRKIRAVAPDLTIATRSRITNPQILAGLYQEFRKLRVADHFVVADKDDPVTLLRRLNLIERLSEQQQRPLASYLGDRWGVVLFADVSGFTTATEQLWHSNRQLLVGALEQFYDQAAAIITDHGGIVDKLIGDEVMGLFIADGRDVHEQPVVAAVEAALGILHGNKTLAHKFAISRWRDSDDSVDAIPWAIKIGIEAGSLVLREHALPRQQTELCTIGYAVNVASRIKGYFEDASITLGPTVAGRLPRAYKLEETPAPVALKGLRRPLLLYKLVT